MRWAVLSSASRSQSATSTQLARRSPSSRPFSTLEHDKEAARTATAAQAAEEEEAARFAALRINLEEMRAEAAADAAARRAIPSAEEIVARVRAEMEASPEWQAMLRAERAATREMLHADAERVWGGGWKERAPLGVFQVNAREREIPSAIERCKPLAPGPPHACTTCVVIRPRGSCRVRMQREIALI